VNFYICKLMFNVKLLSLIKDCVCHIKLVLKLLQELRMSKIISWLKIGL